MIRNQQHHHQQQHGRMGSSCCFIVFLLSLLLFVNKHVVVVDAAAAVPVGGPEPEDHEPLAKARARGADLPTAEEMLVDKSVLAEQYPPYADFPGKMYAGRLPMNNHNPKSGKDRVGLYMFWMFVPDTPIVPDAWIMWLNGGPGCSAFNAGVLFEHSPVTIPLRPAGYCCSDKNDPLTYNPYSWALAAPIVYLEQPATVGFSEGSPMPETEDDIAGDAYAFLMNLYQVFPDILAPKRFFMTGESYAGYFVPAISHKVHRENLKPSSPNSRHVRLVGMAAGNGWMDARVQGPATIDYAYWHGMIDQNTRENLHAEWDHCMTSSKHDPEPAPFHKFNTPDDCAMMEAVLMAGGQGVFPNSPGGPGPNTYDVTTWDNYPVFRHYDDGNNTFELFLNDPVVKDLLHAPKHVYWRGCIEGAGRRRRQLKETDADAGQLLAHDRPESVVPYVAELLDADIRVLIYNGDRDLSTNAQGSEMLLNAMEWNGQKDWFQAPRGLWTVTDSSQPVAGYTKEHLGLSFVVIYNSGHLVPYNQPENALDLIVRFLKNETFADYPLTSYNNIVPASHSHHHHGHGSSSRTSSRAYYDLSLEKLSLAEAKSDQASTSLFHMTAQELAGSLGIAFVTGLLCAAAFVVTSTKMRNNNKKNNYQPIS